MLVKAKANLFSNPSEAKLMLHSTVSCIFFSFSAHILYKESKLFIDHSGFSSSNLPKTLLAKNERRKFILPYCYKLAVVFLVEFCSPKKMLDEVLKMHCRSMLAKPAD